MVGRGRGCVTQAHLCSGQRLVSVTAKQASLQLGEPCDLTSMLAVAAMLSSRQVYQPVRILNFQYAYNRCT